MVDLRLPPSPGELTCLICLGVYDDPCFCSDGWTYCRVCIGHWVVECNNATDTGTWVSPHTNVRVAKPAVLRSNEAVAARALEEKRRALAERLQNWTTDPREALRSAALILDKGRPVIQHSQLREIFDVVVARGIPWTTLNRSSASRAFAEALSVWSRSRAIGSSGSSSSAGATAATALCDLVTDTGPAAPRALLMRDSAAIQQPVLCLGLVKELLQSFTGAYTRTHSLDWLELARETLEHISMREEHVDSIEVSGRHDEGADGVYVRCGQRCFVCAATGALLALNPPSGAYGVLEQKEGTRGGVSITYADGSPESIFGEPYGGARKYSWEHRRYYDDGLVFPDYAPNWGGEEEDWPAWGEEHDLDLFEALPVMLPWGFEYLPRTPRHLRNWENELECHRDVLGVLFAEALTRHKRSRVI